MRVSLFGKNKEFIEACSKAEATMRLTFGSSLDAAAVFNDAVQRWVQENKVTCLVILEASDTEYSSYKEKLLNIVDASLKEFVEKADYSKELRAARRGPGGGHIISEQLAKKILRDIRTST